MRGGENCLSSFTHTHSLSLTFPPSIRFFPQLHLHLSIQVMGILANMTVLDLPNNSSWAKLIRVGDWLFKKITFPTSLTLSSSFTYSRLFSFIYYLLYSPVFLHYRDFNSVLTAVAIIPEYYIVYLAILWGKIKPFHMSLSSFLLDDSLSLKLIAEQ